MVLQGTARQCYGSCNELSQISERDLRNQYTSLEETLMLFSSFWIMKNSDKEWRKPFCFDAVKALLSFLRVKVYV